MHGTLKNHTVGAALMALALVVGLALGSAQAGDLSYTDPVVLAEARAAMRVAQKAADGDGAISVPNLDYATILHGIGTKTGKPITTSQTAFTSQSDLLSAGVDPSVAATLSLCWNLDK